MELHFKRLREGGHTEDQGLLLGSLISVIQEFKRRIKRKHKDSFIRVLKQNQKPRARGVVNLSSCWEENGGRERQLSYTIEVGHLADKCLEKEASEKE